jgi:geranylgeranyl pyrophosphate synthase
MSGTFQAVKKYPAVVTFDATRAIPPEGPMINGLAILDLMHDDLNQVERKMRTMGEDVFGPLSAAFLQLLGSGGKRLRPALALIAYHLFVEDSSDKAISLAAAVETLHTATLVHDDLIDNAFLRRGKTTLNTVWSKGATVLAGDYLFARAAGFAADTGNVRVVQLFAETLRIICDGELRQMFTSRQWDLPKESYYQRIFAKTASLFASAARSGSILAGAPEDAGDALYNYAHDLGMAFQIVDDILDFVGDEAVLGKPVGSDLRQGTVTLPYFYFLQAQPDPQVILSRLRTSNGSDEAVQEVVAMVRDSDAIAKARREACDFAERAKTSLAMLPTGTYCQSLLDLADFVVARDV